MFKSIYVSVGEACLYEYILQRRDATDVSFMWPVVGVYKDNDGRVTDFCFLTPGDTSIKKLKQTNQTDVKNVLPSR